MKRTICLIYFVINAVIVSLLLFAAGSTDYYIKREQLFSNIIYLAAGLFITAVVLALVLRFRETFEGILDDHGGAVVGLTLLIFLLLSIFICTSGFFYSDWDPLAILHAVFGLLDADQGEVGRTYFSNHPNNLLIVWIYLMVLKVTSLFGVRSVLVLVAFQCLLATVSAFIFYRILRDAVKDSLVIPYMGLLAYEIWIVLFPWYIITYTDEPGIIFPLLILRSYQKLSPEKISTWIIYSSS